MGGGACGVDPSVRAEYLSLFPSFTRRFQVRCIYPSTGVTSTTTSTNCSSTHFHFVPPRPSSRRSFLQRKDTPLNGQLAPLPLPSPLFNRLISSPSPMPFHLICLILPRPVPLIHPCPVPAIYRAPPRPVLYYAILLSHARAVLLRVLVNIFLCVCSVICLLCTPYCPYCPALQSQSQSLRPPCRPVVFLLPALPLPLSSPSLYSLIVYWPIGLLTTYTYISGGGIASQKEDSIREFWFSSFC